MPSRRVHDLGSYLHLAREREVTLLDFSLPANIRQPIRWRCDRCGRLLVKSFSKLRYGAHPCRCRADKALTEIDYHLLARELGLRWTPPGDSYFPATARTRTTWTRADGTLLRATYADLRWYNKEPRDAD